MSLRITIIQIAFLLIFISSGYCQLTEKIVFNNKDSANDYYLAIRPLSGNIKGVQFLLCGFLSPESVLAETKLANVAYGNDLLTIMVSIFNGFAADSEAVERINHVLKNVISRFSPDTSKFVFGGYLYSGQVILRYTEMCYEHPGLFPIQPKAVFVLECPVDLLGLARWCEREIKKNYFAGNVGDGKYILDVFNKKYGPYSEQRDKYIQLSAFNIDSHTEGNEQFLKHVPVRLYYDTDIEWELSNRRNSYHDTYFPDGSELVKRLLLMGNNEAEFIASKQPGLRSNGKRNPFSWSIVDEVDCIQWIKQKLKIFNPETYVPVYQLLIPANWSVERFSLPPDFAKQIVFTGIEDIRFAPGWGDVKSEEYWSYAYLWWLDKNKEVNVVSLQDNLNAYYSGLLARNIPTRRIPKDKLFPVSVNLSKIKTASDDTETYSGKIYMLDYMEQKPILLNAIVHKKICPDKDHFLLFFEISPKASNDPVWEKMNKLYNDFKCGR